MPAVRAVLLGKLHRVAADPLAVVQTDFIIGPEVNAAIQPGNRGFLRLRIEVSLTAGKQVAKTAWRGPGERGMPRVIRREIGKADHRFDGRIHLLGARVEVGIFRVPARHRGIM